MTEGVIFGVDGMGLDEITKGVDVMRIELLKLVKFQYYYLKDTMTLLTSSFFLFSSSFFLSLSSIQMKLRSVIEECMD